MSLSARLTEFQFHSGSIQTSEYLGRGLSFASFQFHSGSIQTTQPRHQLSKPRPVSIPLWFDSNDQRTAWDTWAQFQFQFHSGSIQTVQPLSTRKTAQRFNSTLVRFKRCGGIRRELCDDVSIPLWFDSNAAACDLCGGVAGFNSTLVRFKRV